jgi:hypothetical protein
VSLSRRELLQRATALVVLSRPKWLDQGFAATPSTVRQTLDALVGFVVPGKKVRAGRLRG